MSRPNVRGLAFRACAPAILLACVSCRHAAEEAEKEEPAAVVVVPVRTADFEKVVRAVGSVTALPDRLAPVTTLIEGRVAEVLAAEGDEVEAGKPLVRLDDRLAHRDLEEKKAARDEAAASLALVKAPPREPERRAADLDVDRAKVAVDLARQTLTLLEPLLARKEVSEPQHYEAARKLEEATLALKAAEAHREALLQGPRPEAVVEAEAKLASARAAVESADLRVALHVLVAPRAGTVDRVLCRLGQTLAVGAEAAQVVDPSEVLVVVAVTPRDAISLSAGQEARVRPGSAEAGEADPPLPGKVTSVGIQAISATGSVPARVRVTDTKRRLRLGTLASVELVTGKDEKVLAVPEAAVMPFEEGPTLVVIRDKKAVLLRPELGARSGGLVEVTVAGLKPGDLVVVEGGFDLKPDSPVEVREAAAKGEHAAPEKQEEAAAKPGESGPAGASSGQAEGERS